VASGTNTAPFQLGGALGTAIVSMGRSIP